MYINDYLSNNDIADIRKARKERKAVAIGARSYYYKDDSGSFVFVSYWTEIARYAPETKCLDFICHDLDAYSRTTVKHLGVFMQAMQYSHALGIADIRKIAAAGWNGMKR